MVRPGLLLYGYYPGSGVRNKIPLKPVMNLKSRVTFIKKIEKGESVSYNRRYFAAKQEFIGSVPIGYGDGYQRKMDK